MRSQILHEIHHIKRFFSELGQCPSGQNALFMGFHWHNLSGPINPLYIFSIAHSKRWLCKEILIRWTYNFLYGVYTAILTDIKWNASEVLDLLQGNSRQWRRLKGFFPNTVSTSMIDKELEKN